jgi:hypothetical protein
MEIVYLLFRQNAVMFLYMLVGFLLYKNKMLTKTGSGELGKLLLYAVIPMAIIKSYMKDFSRELFVGFVISFFAALVLLILSILISSLFFSKKDAIRQFGAAFSNAGFIGIPLVQATIGEDAVFYIASFVSLLNILQWTYGIWIMTRDKSAISLKKIPTNPIVISIVIGLLLFFLPVTLPEVLSSVVGTLASMNGPLAMIVLGAYLAQIPFKDLVTDKLTYLCTLVRLFVIPFATILVLLLLPDSYSTIRLAVLLAAAAPVGANVAIFAQLYGKEYTDAVKDVCLSTICSIVTMPLIVALANMIW